MAFRPLAGSNAIESCNLSIRFPTPIGEDVFKAVFDTADVLAASNNLPARTKIEPPAFLANIPGAPALATAATFQRYATDGKIEVDLRCETQTLAFTVRSYSTWREFYDAVERLVFPLLPIYLSSVPAITAIVLQYEDVFLAKEGVERPVAGEMFRSDTKWVALYDPTTDQPWHSHFGIFLPKTNANRELINVNVTVADQVRSPANVPQRVTNITMLTGDMYDVPGEMPLVVPAGEEAIVVGTIVQSLHGTQRTILGEVLTDSYLAAIGC